MRRERGGFRKNGNAAHKRRGFCLLDNKQRFFRNSYINFKRVVNNMVTITYGESSGPRTSKGRRKMRRIEKSIARALEQGLPRPECTRSATKAEKIGKREASPRYLLATMSDLSFRPYVGDISSKNEDAMNKVVNHAHQRPATKKW